MNFLLGTFFDFGTVEQTAMIDHGKNLLTDLTPILVIVLGIGVGVIIVTAIINAIKR